MDGGSWLGLNPGTSQRRSAGRLLPLSSNLSNDKLVVDDTGGRGGGFGSFILFYFIYQYMACLHEIYVSARYMPD